MPSNLSLPCCQCCVSKLRSSSVMWQEDVIINCAIFVPVLVVLGESFLICLALHLFIRVYCSSACSGSPPIKHRNAGRKGGREEGRERGRDGERKLESKGKMMENERIVVTYETYNLLSQCL